MRLHTYRIKQVRACAMPICIPYDKNPTIKNCPHNRNIKTSTGAYKIAAITDVYMLAQFASMVPVLDNNLEVS